MNRIWVTLVGRLIVKPDHQFIITYWGNTTPWAEVVNGDSSANKKARDGQSVLDQFYET